MKKTIKRLTTIMILAIMILGATGIGFALGNWRGSPEVDKINNHTQEIIALFNKRNATIDELQTELDRIDGTINDKDVRIRELELQVHGLHETIVLKDQEILIKVQEIQALENELAYAFQDVKGIEKVLRDIVETEKGND